MGELQFTLAVFLLMYRIDKKHSKINSFTVVQSCFPLAFSGKREGCAECLKNSLKLL